jgi:MoaA/NifB/PqqE/SkfB family radical SAM enzyme
LNIGRNGEPFDSRHYMRILSALHSDQHPNLQVALLTNGLGLTKQRLSQFEQRGVLFESVEVAVDAATAETYEALRRRGRFPVLLENLSAISEFRRRGAIRHLALSYVVQASNYREMASFVSLANQVGVDRILFRPLDDWKVMSAERFAKKAVHDRRHPEHEQFRALLADPIFQAKSIDLGGLGALIADEPSGQVT